MIYFKVLVQKLADSSQITNKKHLISDINRALDEFIFFRKHKILVMERVSLY
jgi:hypothetical protein